MKGIIIFKGKYGATRQYAEWLGNDLALPVITAPEMPGDQLTSYDYVIIGSSVYVGKLQVNEWLKENIEILKNKKVFLFIVCGTPAHEIDKLEFIINKNVPLEIRSNCSISFLPGRVIIKNLGWTDKMLLRIAGMFQKNNPLERKLYSDYHNVKQENILALESDVIKFIREGKNDAGLNCQVSAVNSIVAASHK